jgi:hypothetical protein
MNLDELYGDATERDLMQEIDDLSHATKLTASQRALIDAALNIRSEIGEGAPSAKQVQDIRRIHRDLCGSLFGPDMDDDLDVAA